MTYSDDFERKDLGRYDLKVKCMDDIYLFELNYGTYSNSYCNVSKDDKVFVNFGIDNNLGEDELSKRKEDMINEILKPMFGIEKAKRIVEVGILYIKLAYKKAEKFIIDNDLFVSNEEYLEKKELNSKDYEFRTVYDEGVGTISFYVKSKLFDDEFGIIIYQDASFYPVISTKHISENLTEEAQKQRLNAIKEFVYEVLNVKINFGTTIGKNNEIVPIRIKKLLKKATTYAKENGSIEYTDENGDIFTYKESSSDVVSLPKIGKI